MTHKEMADYLDTLSIHYPMRGKDEDTLADIAAALRAMEWRATAGCMKVKWSIMASGTVDVSVDELQDTSDVMPGRSLSEIIAEIISDEVFASGLDIRIDNIEEVERELETA